MSDSPKIAVVVVNYRTPDLTLRCLAALRDERSLLPSLTAIVVDGGSGDGSAEALETALSDADYRDWVTFLPLALNGGFGWANNQAMMMLAKLAHPPEFIQLLNPDTEVRPGAVVQLLNELQTNPRCGAAGSQLLSSDGEVSASAFRFPSPAREFIGTAQSAMIGRVLGIDGIVILTHESCEVDWVTGASVMFRVRALMATGLFDDGFFLYFEEVELLHRLKASGWTVRHVPSSRVIHIEGASTGLGAAATARPFPPYWYRSRRRYFELTGGTAGLVAANLCSLAGLAIVGLKRFGGRTRASKAFRGLELYRSGFWPSGAAARPSIPRLGDVPGRPPNWMVKS